MAVTLDTSAAQTGTANASRSVTITTTAACLCLMYASADVQLPTTISGGGLTWNSLVNIAGAYRVWWAWAATALSSQTITVSGFGVSNTTERIIFSAWAGTQNATPGFTNSSGSGAANFSRTATFTGSQQVFHGMQNSTGASTLASNNNDLLSTVTSLRFMGSYYNTLTTAGVGQTLGFTNTGVWAATIIEIKAAATAGAHCLASMGCGT